MVESTQNIISFIVASLTGVDFEFDLPPETTIQELTQYFYKRAGIPQVEQRFVFNKKKINNFSKSLASIGIGNGARLFVVLSLRGGFVTSIPFSDLTKKPVTISDKGACFGAEWQRLENGINLIGDHLHDPKCKASGKQVYVPLGMGLKNIAKEIALA